MCPECGGCQLGEIQLHHHGCSLLKLEPLEPEDPRIEQAEYDKEWGEPR